MTKVRSRLSLPLSGEGMIVGSHSSFMLSIFGSV